jgi:hypothetical protein
MSKITYLNSLPPPPAAGAWEKFYVSLLRLYRPAFPALIWLACVVLIVFARHKLGPDNVKEDLFYYLTIIFVPCTLLASFMSTTVLVDATPAPDGLVAIWAESPNSWRRTRYVEEILEWRKVLDIVTTHGGSGSDESWWVAVSAAEPFHNNESHLQLIFQSETKWKVWTRAATGYRDAYSSDNTQ